MRPTVQKAGALAVPRQRGLVRQVSPVWRRRLRPWLLLVPAGVFVLLAFAYPLVEVVRLSLRSSFTGEFAGLQNFRNLFLDPTFPLALRHNGLLLLAVPVLTFWAVVLAIFLFEAMRGWRLYRVLIFLPVTVAIPVVGGVWSFLLEKNGGVNSILRSLGLGAAAPDWLGNPDLALWSVLGVIVWSQLGFGVVLFLARLLSIPPELFEAARLDGARSWRLHRYVTVPQLKGILQFYVVLMTITIMSWIFGYVFVMTGGGPADATIVAELYIYREAFTYNQIGIASAGALVLLASVLIFIFLFFRFTGREEVA
jgi:ABC-type sugar transport system permease subunit